MRGLAAWTIVLAWLLGGSTASADVFDSDEFQVNSYTTGNQTVPEGADVASFGDQDPSGAAIGIDAAGNFVIVWTSSDQEGASDYGIFGQRYDQHGVAVGAELHVNSYTSGPQTGPTVGMNNSGAFVVAWQETGDGDPDGVFAKLFASDGTVVRDDFRVNTEVSGVQQHVSAAMHDDGSFVVVWDSGDDHDGSDDGVYGQRYDSVGQAVGDAYLINSWTTGNQRYPDVAIRGSDQVLVTWQSGAGSTGVYQDGELSGIYAQLFDSLGATVGGEFQVNTYTTSSQDLPRVASVDGGEFVITWHSDGSADTDHSDNSIHGQLYAAGGAAVGGEFQVNTYTSSEQVFPDVAMAPDGAFVIAWSSLGQLEPLLSNICEIYAQDYDASGAPSGAEYMVNGTVTALQTFPALVADGDGDYVVVWASGPGPVPFSTYSQDGDGFGVFARHGIGPLFADDFETGDTAMWSGGVP
jgi:hypothetical protein